MNNAFASSRYADRWEDDDFERGMPIWYCPYCPAPGWFDEITRDVHVIRHHPGKPVVWDQGATVEFIGL